ncbi:anthranilate synthase component II [Bellilinea sp.]|jgi:anthranilate synthase/aminodeoxychorismate synthase-like glutamine amidotransferase
MMLLILDNYDSFTYNLAQLFGELGEQVQVVRSDQVSLADVLDLHPQRIVISPGPGGPQDAGISSEVIRRLGGVIPILGVCLGHQCIGAVFGGQVVRAARLMHGKTSQIFHNGEDLFAGLPNPFEATRYHSLMVAEPLPEALMPTAYSEAGELMALRHRSLPIFGVQFHPESILTSAGRQILDNFLKLTVNQPLYS